jgi:hypothetical protein
MSKNTLLMAIAAGVFTATAAGGAFAQTSSGNSSGAMSNDSAAATTDSSTMTKHKKPRKHMARPSSGKKTPEATTGNNAGAESGQSK